MGADDLGAAGHMRPSRRWKEGATWKQRRWRVLLAATVLIALKGVGSIYGQVSVAQVTIPPEYHLRAGESAVLNTFGLTSVGTVSANPSPRYPFHATLRPDRTSLRVTVPPSTRPGVYAVSVPVTDAAGTRRTITFRLTVAVPQLEPLPAPGTAPVILLNGWQAVCGNTDSTLLASEDTFGTLDSQLQQNLGLSVAFFNNCSYGDISIEALAQELGSFLNALTYSDGSPVSQFDLVTHSMGGLIARAYLAGLQSDGSLAPPADPRVRKLVLIASPNFGAFAADSLIADVVFVLGTQTDEMEPGSELLWRLATWNQEADDLRGVDAIAIVGTAGTCGLGYFPAPCTVGENDGIVSSTSASLGFATYDSSRTRLVPYCHTSSISGPYCNGAPPIANVDQAPETGEIIESFLLDASAWMSIGGTPMGDPLLSRDGGIYLAWANSADQFFNDLNFVEFGSSSLNAGAWPGTVFYGEFVPSGTAQIQIRTASDSSAGLQSCGSYTEPAGYYSAVRCKSGASIWYVTPYLTGVHGMIVRSRTTIAINGAGFGPQQCSVCRVFAAGNPLSVSSWSDSAISAYLSPLYTGLVTIQVQAAAGSDAMNIMASPGVTLAASPSALQFSYTPGSPEQAQTIEITSTGGVLDWTATANAGWVALSVSSGATPEALQVSLNPTGLPAGTYAAQVEIAAAGTNANPVVVPVTLSVQAPPTPAVQLTSVVNGASFQSGLASGTWISIFGVNLAPSVAAWNGSDFINGQLPTSLDGVSVSIDGRAAYVAYVSPGQINALAPDDPAVGPAPVQVTTAAGVSNTLSTDKQAVAPAFFMLGGSYVAAVHADGTYVGKPGLISGAVTRPAQPGEIIMLFGTGFGATTPPQPASELVTSPVILGNQVQVMIGGVSAKVNYAGLVESGLDQINVTVPSVPTGDATISATVAGGTTQAGMSITVQN